MSSRYYSETQSFQTDSDFGSNGYVPPLSSGVNVPVQHTSSYNANSNDQRLQQRIRNPDTTVKWVSDTRTGSEAFRVHVNIDGFAQHEVTMRLEGNKIIVYGEHTEIKQQSSTKKIIEKSFELPQGIDSSRPQITYPTPTLMQIDFPSLHSNVIIDDGRLSSKLVSNYDASARTQPRFTEERTSNEYTSTRRIGGAGAGTGTGVTSNFQRNSSPRDYTHYDTLRTDRNTNRINASSTFSRPAREHYSPPRKEYITTKSDAFENSIKPIYTYTVNADDSQLRTIKPKSSRGDNDNVYEKSYTETHRETRHRRSSPTSGVQSSHEVEHHRSGSPSIARTVDVGRFQTDASFGKTGSIQPSSSHNVEVREFSRRFGTDGTGNNVGRSVFSHGFNADAFYRSAFRPLVFIDDRGQNCIEMTLDVHNYQPNEIKLSVESNDLIVKAEHNDDQPPTSSTRAYFYKQITLPPNTDLNSITSTYLSSGNLIIKAKLSNPQTSIRFN